MENQVIEYQNGVVRVMDQTRLPQEEHWVALDSLAAVETAIVSMQVRGAPLIGVAAAYGLCAALRHAPGPQAPLAQAQQEGAKAIAVLRATRPTAVNLFWALDRMEAALAAQTGPGWLAALEAEAARIDQDNRRADEQMARHGLGLLAPGAQVITHCNTGPLATGGLGTALGVLIHAHQKLGGLHVYADETRPRLQGSRLTAYELRRAQVPHTLICDNMAAFLMSRQTIHSVWVGADRIAANGDTANKIGTFSLALAAKHHGVPFYVAAPRSTIDPLLADGSTIPIEERDPREVWEPALALPGTPVWNPAFDVTPAQLISAIVTEEGVFKSPFRFKS